MEVIDLVASRTSANFKSIKKETLTAGESYDGSRNDTSLAIEEFDKRRVRLSVTPLFANETIGFDCFDEDGVGAFFRLPLAGALCGEF